MAFPTVLERMRHSMGAIAIGPEKARRTHVMARRSRKTATYRLRMTALERLWRSATIGFFFTSLRS
jgi:hypothetical protein